MENLLGGFLPATVVGFSALNILTHQKSPIWKRMEKRRFPKTKRIQLIPSIRVKHSNRIIHFHHWMTFSVLLGASFLFNIKILDYVFTQGFLLGGIIQGLSDPMSRKLIYPINPLSETYHHKL